MGENRVMHDLYNENQRLKARIEELEAKHFQECGQIAHYDDELKAVEEVARRTAECGKASPVDFLDLLDENAKLKELLKEATSDIKAILREDFGEICVFCKWFDKEDFECAKPNNGSGSQCCEYAGWRREGETLALIGGEEK